MVTSAAPLAAVGAPRIDPRGMRFTAAVTAVVLVAVLATGSGWLLLAQTVLFGVAAFGGLRFGLWGQVFRRAIRPRLGPPAELEDEAPPRFAQLVGFVFAAVGTIGYLSGVTVLGAVFAGFALVAALLNASVGLCLGCEMYLGWKRLTARS